MLVDISRPSLRAGIGGLETPWAVGGFHWFICHKYNYDFLSDHRAFQHIHGWMSDRKKRLGVKGCASQSIMAPETPYRWYWPYFSENEPSGVSIQVVESAVLSNSPVSEHESHLQYIQRSPARDPLLNEVLHKIPMELSVSPIFLYLKGINDVPSNIRRSYAHSLFWKIKL